MWIDIISMFTFSLTLTIIIEASVARVWGLKSRKEMLLVLLVNILTNPAAVFCVWICNGYLGSHFSFLYQCIVEFVVVVVEGKVYSSFAKEEGWNIKKPLQFSFVVNMISWLSGVVLQYII